MEIDQEDLGGLLQIPTTGRAQLEDPQPLRRQVVGSSPSAGAGPATVLDRELLAQHGDLVRRLVEPCIQTPASLGESVGDLDDGTGERDGVKDARFDVLGPLARKEDRGANVRHGIFRSTGGLLS